MCDRQSQAGKKKSGVLVGGDRLYKPGIFWACLVLLGGIFAGGCSLSKNIRTDRGGGDQADGWGGGNKAVARKSPPADSSTESLTTTRSYGAPAGAPRRTSARSYRPMMKYQRRRQIVRRHTEVRPGLGTAYGRSLYAPVRETTFYRSRSTPGAVFRLYYNSVAGVHAMARAMHQRSCCGRLPYTYRSGLSVQLVDSVGRALPGLRVGGRTVVMGRHHQRYQIRLRNHTGRRLEVVVSVDGLDVIDGRRANTDKRGYILQPHQSLCINGFRRSFSHVAAFRFSRVSRSYAGLTSGTRNVGVIGVAAFSEIGGGYDPNDARRRWSANPFQY